MPLSLSRRSSVVVRSEIRVISIECEKVGGINLAQRVCDTEVPFAGMPGDAFFSGDDGRNLVRFCVAKLDAELEEACRRLARA